MTEEIKTGGDLFIEAMLAENVRYLFGIPGGQMLPMYDAVQRWGREQGIDTINFRHEQAAAHAADAWSRLTGKPGVCFGTVGPGTTHLVPGVACAQADNIPMVVVAPTVAYNLSDSFGLQSGLDQMNLMKPITKYQKHVEKTDEIPTSIQKAFRQTTTGRPGPVFLEITKEAFYGRTELKHPISEPSDYRPVLGGEGHPELIKQAAKLIIKSKEPVMIAGGGVIMAGAWEEFRALSAYCKIPAMTTFMGIGAISSESDTFIGATMSSPAAQNAGQSDLVLAFGCKFSHTLALGREPMWKIDKQKLVHVDIDPTMIGHNRPVDVAIVGDCKLVLKQLLEEIKRLQPAPVEKRPWLSELRRVRANSIESVNKRAMKEARPMLPERMLKEVLEFINEDAIIVIDGGDIVLYTLLQIDFYKPRPPRSTLNSVSMGHLGTIIPYAVGACLARPDKQVVGITGDGSFLFNIQELETAVRYDLPFIIIVANNSAWGMIKANQQLNFKKRFIDTDFPDINYADIARGFGCHAERISDPAEIKPALKRAVDSKKPSVLDIIIDFKIPKIRKLLASIGLSLG
ncbi:MAG: thiamine pyrophosphate-binding protein [Candidatus Helarchaeota archaeon]